MSLLVLSGPDVDRVTSALTSETLQNLMAEVFFYISANKNIVTPQRSGIEMSKFRALFMPSRIAGVGTSIKVVSVPTGPSRGLPGSTLVIDEDTGAAKAIVNASNLTALRTAAGSILATALLHPPDDARFRTLVAFGAGKQIQAHVDLLLTTYQSLEEVTIVNRSLNERITGLVSYLRSRHPSVVFKIGVTSISSEIFNLQAAVTSADIICTATSSSVPLFPSEWVRPGVHLILVGSYTPSMHEIDTELVHRGGVIVVDSREACLVEAGELLTAGIKEEGIVEIGQLVQEIGHEEGQWKWKRNDEMVARLSKVGDVTIFKSVGVGAQDVAIAAAVVERAKKMGVGVTVKDYNE